MESDFVYHIASKEEWDKAQNGGEYTVPSLESEGFIHFSTLKQCSQTANLYYSSASSLLLLQISSKKLNSKMLWEKSRNEELFPHLYGALNIDAVEVIHNWSPEANGRYEEPSSSNLSVQIADN